MSVLSSQIQRSVTTLIFALLGSVILLSAAYALSLSGEMDWQSQVGVGVTVYLLFSAVACVGGLLGFVFGMPRGRLAEAALVSSTAQPAASGTQGAAGSPGASPMSHFLVNSNLIKVSDWLTTILLGLGLVNLKSLVPASQELIADLAPALGGADYAGVVGLSVCVIGLVAGFLLGYLWTSLKYRHLLEEAELEYSGGVPDVVGMTIAQAKTLLGSTPLKLRAPPGASATDLIQSQQPPAGDRVNLGAEILAST